MSTVASSERSPRRSTERDLKLVRALQRKLAADLLLTPNDPVLLAEQEELIVLRERIERAAFSDD